MPLDPVRHNRRYGRAHRRLRQQWAPRVRAGLVDCARCGRRILPRDAWDLGHVDGTDHYQGPEHAECNRATAAHTRGRGRGGRVGDPQPQPRTKW